MSSEVKSTKGDDEDFSCGLLLRDVEEISKALHLHKLARRTFNSPYEVARTGIFESKSNVIIQRPLQKDKKSSIWNWKPLKALAHIRDHRFNCCFFLRVHSIEGLPPSFNNLNLCVAWKQKTNMLRTRPARACLGMAQFEETLMYRCNIYGSKSGPHSSTRYDAKLFLLHAYVIEAPGIDIGNQWIDLSRLLPLTMEELDEENSSSGKWTTSFKLTGKAKGAILNVSFGFSILDGNSFEPGYFVKVPDNLNEGRRNHLADSDIHNLGNLPSISTRGSYHGSLSGYIRSIEEVFLDQESELSESVTLLYRKLDEEKLDNVMEFDIYHEHLESDPSSESASGKIVPEFSDTEFDMVDRGIEVSMKDERKTEMCSSRRLDGSVIETIDVAKIFEGEETAFDEFVEWNSKFDTNNHGGATDDREHKDNSLYIIESAELDSFNSLLTGSEYYELEKYMKSKSGRLTKSLSLDDVAESIENDFLNMLNIDQGQDDIVSGCEDDLPEDLRRLFEEDNSLASGKPILDMDLLRGVAFQDDFDLSCAYGSVNRSIMSKKNAEVLENLETEALMQEWGLNETAFQSSPRATSGGFGSPVYIPAEEPLKLPSIEEDLGPIIWTKDGGFLRSMNPLLFRSANNGAKLVVQVSSPVVLPSAMGSTIMEILQCWASRGVKKMCIQANELMPLEDVTGKTMQQVLSEAESESDAFNRTIYRWASRRESDVGVEKKPAEYLPFPQSSDTMYSCSNSKPIKSDYLSFKDLVPMAITNIEGLLVEGLKIQTGTPDREAPSSIRIKNILELSTLGKVTELSRNFGTEKASSLEVLDVDELVKYTLPLKEWIMLDSGEFYVEDEPDEIMMKLYAAHCAKLINFGNGQATREDEKIKLLDRSCGILNNNFRMGLKVQLRDPLRNYETVGSSMLALIEVDRVYSAWQPGDGLNEQMILEGTDFKKIYEPLFKIAEVHLAGLNVANDNTHLWGTSRQRQSGSRWLLSSGMTKSNKNPVSKSNAIIKSSFGLMRKAWPGDVLWSISFPIEGEAATWDEQVALNVHLRNPDIIFPTESVK